MKIRSVAVSRLFGRFDHFVDIRPGGLTFIHSPNGYGKSIFMRMIYLILRGDTEELKSIPFSRFDMSFVDDTNLIIENDSGGLRIHMQRNRITSELTPDELKSLGDVTYIQSERLVVKKMDGRLVPALETYAAELSERLKDAKDNTNLTKVEGNSMNGDELVFFSKDLKAKLDFIKDAGFEAEIPAGMKFPPHRHDVNTSFDDYLDLVHSLSDFVKRNYFLAESIVVFKDIINNLLIGKNLNINEKGTIGIQLDDGTSIPLNRLSSGEKQIFVMIYRLLFHAAPGSIVLIDEPEISLHVSWQQTLGSTLLDLARLRDLQIIVTTHSPQIIHDKWDLTNELRADRA